MSVKSPSPLEDWTLFVITISGCVIALAIATIKILTANQSFLV